MLISQTSVIEKLNATESETFNLHTQTFLESNTYKKKLCTKLGHSLFVRKPIQKDHHVDLLMVLVDIKS